jgi:hypothetical protein
MKKLKTYVLTVSQVFPSYHPQKGELTNFPCSILSLTKIHTIRQNYELWKKRIDEVNAGRAVLSIRYWDGKPYKDRQVEFQRLDKDSGIGIQKLTEMSFSDNTAFIDGVSPLHLEAVADNDGLTLQQFKDWFRTPNSEPMAIIHFTSFRYGR